MRVAIEIDYAGAGARGGTQTLNSLLDAFARIDRENEYFVFGFFYREFERKIRQFRIPKADNIGFDIKRWPQALVTRLEWRMKVPLIEAYLAAKRVDVYHCFRVPSWGGGNVALIQQDITPVTHPQWHVPESFKQWREIGLPGLLRAKRVITYCQATRRDIVRELRIPEERIRVVRLGVDHALFHPIEDAAPLAAAREKYRLPERFFLLVGPFDQVAGFDAVLDALAEWKKHGEPPKIVAAGSLDEYTLGLKKKADEAGLGESFIWAGYVPHAELIAVYNLAVALLHPSLLPGLEMPPDEAMACGTPVITSLDENVGEAGLLVDPRSGADLHAAMRKVWESPSLRAQLREKGLRHAATLTWDRTARETIEVYRDVVAA